jgi:hypothetical protein
LTDELSDQELRNLPEDLEELQIQYSLCRYLDLAFYVPCETLDGRRDRCFNAVVAKEAREQKCTKAKVEKELFDQYDREQKFSTHRQVARHEKVPKKSKQRDRKQS